MPVPVNNAELQTLFSPNTTGAISAEDIQLLAASSWNVVDTPNFGSQGPQGSQGSTGSQGNQGPQGNQGGNGSQGNQGFQGSQGNQGPQGPTGVQGNQGSTGSQGNQGFQGPTGAQGNQGFQGPTGAQGNQGPNTVSTTTATALNSILRGDGSHVQASNLTQDGSGDITASYNLHVIGSITAANGNFGCDDYGNVNANTIGLNTLQLNDSSGDGASIYLDDNFIFQIESGIQINGNLVSDNGLIYTDGGGNLTVQNLQMNTIGMQGGGKSVGTLNNCPADGDASTYIPIILSDGNTYYIPAWASGGH